LKLNDQLGLAVNQIGTESQCILHMFHKKARAKAQAFSALPLGLPSAKAQGKPLARKDFIQIKKPTAFTQLAFY